MFGTSDFVANNDSNYNNKSDKEDMQEVVLRPRDNDCGPCSSTL